MGKTTLAMNIAENAAIKHDVPVAIFSMEMSALQLVNRLKRENALEWLQLLHSHIGSQIPGLRDIRAAARRIDGHVHRTPVMTSSALDAMAGCSLFFKCENLQKVGAFKIRGATNAVFCLGEEEVAATKEAMGWPKDETFRVPSDALAHCRAARERVLPLTWRAHIDRWMEVVACKRNT